LTSGTEVSCAQARFIAEKAGGRQAIILYNIEPVVDYCFYLG